MKFGAIENRKTTGQLAITNRLIDVIYYAICLNIINVIKTLLLYIAAMSLIFTTTAQVKKTSSAILKKSEHLKVFEQSMNSGDALTATIALNYYLSQEGANNNYADTLAMLYMQRSLFPQCYYWVQIRLQAKPDDTNLMELKGICLDKLQQPKEAIDLFEKLFKKTQSPYHAYKLMELQYGIKRLTECVETAMAAEKLTYKPNNIMTYTVGEQVGRTYLQAGVYNIHALALYDLDKKAEAKIYFEKALALDTSFVLAKQNLEAMRSIEPIGTKNNVVPNNQQQGAPAANKQN
jgi:tetratricopeptide (TPR) repeat protein